MYPQNLFPFKFRISLDFFDHKTHQIQEFLRTDQQMHAHHHIQMADQLSRIIILALKLKETHQLFSCLILDTYVFSQFLLVKCLPKTPFQLSCKIPELSCQIFYRSVIIPVRHIQKRKRYSFFLFQIAEGIQIAVAGKGGGHRVPGRRHSAAVNGSHKRLMIGT